MRPSIIIIAIVIISSLSSIIQIPQNTDPSKCIREKCEIYVTACLKDPACNKDREQCQKKCGSNSMCWMQCLQSKGNKAALDATSCAEAHGCNKSPSQINQNKTDFVVCVQGKCLSQSIQCYKDSKCIPAMESCTKKCGTHTPCWKTCLENQKSQAAFDLGKCAIAQGCQKLSQQYKQAAIVNNLITCNQQKCKDPLKNCRKDQQCYKNLYHCEKKCQNNELCFTKCLDNKNNSKSVIIWDCLVKNKCMEKPNPKQFALILADPQTCASNKCSKYQSACNNDPKCQLAHLNCRKQCGYAMNPSCWDLCLQNKGNDIAIKGLQCIRDQGCNRASLSVKLLNEANQNLVQQCLEVKCIDKIATCSLDPICLPIIQSCKMQCSNNTNINCHSQCMKNQKMPAAQAFGQCFESQGCNSPNLSNYLGLLIFRSNGQLCMKKNCIKQYKICQMNSQCSALVLKCEDMCIQRNDRDLCYQQCGLKDHADLVAALNCAIKSKCL